MHLCGRRLVQAGRVRCRQIFGQIFGVCRSKGHGEIDQIYLKSAASPPAPLISHLCWPPVCWSAGVHLHMAVIVMHGCPPGHHICMCTHRHADSRTAQDSTAQQGAALLNGWHRPSRRPPKKRTHERDDTACPLYRPDACNAADGRTPACHGPSLGITDYYEHKEHRLTSSCITRD